MRQLEAIRADSEEQSRGHSRHDRHEGQRQSAYLLRLRQMQIHFVAVKVGIVRRAHALVEAQRAARHDACPVRHDRELMK